MTDSPLSFEVYTDTAGQWRWRARQADNADAIIADSGEGYPTREGALEALNTLRTYAEQAAVTELAATGPRGQQFAHDLRVELGGDE